jgi:hypothetical protein
MADLDLIALADFCDAGDIGGFRQRRQQKGEQRNQEFHEHEQAAFNGRIA